MEIELSSWQLRMSLSFSATKLDFGHPCIGFMIWIIIKSIVGCCFRMLTSSKKWQFFGSDSSSMQVSEDPVDVVLLWFSIQDTPGFVLYPYYSPHPSTVQISETDQIYIRLIACLPNAYPYSGASVSLCYNVFLQPSFENIASSQCFFLLN
eukprot:NODE_862_length_3619_cov_0.153977.p3 type:complete len:151 gc:universal NODE_862_length_3619_cov_0.153977:1278-826(-)